MISQTHRVVLSAPEQLRDLRLATCLHPLRCFATHSPGAPLIKMKTWKHLWPFLLSFLSLLLLSPSPPLFFLTPFSKIQGPSSFPSLPSPLPSIPLLYPLTSPFSPSSLLFPFSPSLPYSRSFLFPSLPSLPHLPLISSPPFPLQSVAPETHFTTHQSPLTTAARTPLSLPHPPCWAGSFSAFSTPCFHFSQSVTIPQRSWETSLSNSTSPTIRGFTLVYHLWLTSVHTHGCACIYGQIGIHRHWDCKGLAGLFYSHTG